MNDIPLIDTTELKEAIKLAASISSELQTMHEDNIEDESCQECEHEFDSSEGFMCLNCGKDGMEDVMCRMHEQSEGMER